MAENNDDYLSQSEKDSVLSMLTRLISIPSVKGDAVPKAPYGTHTLQALEYMLGLGRQHGFTVKNLDGRAGYIEWGSGEKMLGLLCHLDVVPAGEGWSHDPFLLRREKGRLIGRGVIDDKGPAVTLFFAMLRLKNQGYAPPCRIRLILGLDEECGSSCMEHYVKVEELPTCGFTPDADFPAIFAEKGILQLSISGAGSKKIRISAGERPNMVPARCNITWLETNETIDFQGVPAHASKPHLGKNAIYEALSSLDLSRLPEEPLLLFFIRYIGKDTAGYCLLSEPEEDISGALTLNAGVLQMDEMHSELLLDIRYPISSDASHILAEIQKKTNAMGLDVSIYSHQKPLFRNPKDRLLRTLISVYEKHIDRVPFDETTESEKHQKALVRPISPISIGGGTYARSMPEFVAFGPLFPWEKDQAHQIDESMREDSLYSLVQLYQDAIVALCEDMDSLSNESSMR